jgi:predicted nucleic acid-binding protein
MIRVVLDTNVVVFAMGCRRPFLNLCLAGRVQAYASEVGQSEKGRHVIHRPSSEENWAVVPRASSRETFRNSAQT